MACILAALSRVRKAHPGPAAAVRALVLLMVATAGIPVCAGAAPPPIGLAHRFIRWDEVPPLAPTWIRVNLHWGYFQTTSDPDTAHWTWDNDETRHLDGLFSRGYSALAVVRTGTVWANRGTADLPFQGPSYAPDDLVDTWDPATGYSPSYHRFVEALVRHYNGDGVRRIGILVVENEVSSATWWRGRLPDDDNAEAAAQYLRLLATAYHAARAVDPGILVADSGIPSLAFGGVMVYDRLHGADPPDSVLAFANRFNARAFNVSWGWPYYWPTYDSLASDFEHRLAPIVSEARIRMDAIFAGLRPSDRYPPDSANVDVVNFHFYEHYSMLAPLTEFIRGRMGGTLPPLLTNEMGMRSASEPPPDRSSSYEAWGGCGFNDSEGPATELIEKMTVALAAGVSPVTWFILDGDGHGSEGESDKLELSVFDYDPPAGFPVVRRRPAYYAYGFLSEWLRSGGGHGIGIPVRDSCLAPGVYRYVFRDDVTGTPDLELVWWDDGSAHDIGLAARGGARIRLHAPAGATSLAAYDDYTHPREGRAIPVALDGTVELDATHRPMVLEWSGALLAVAPGSAPTCGEPAGGGVPAAGPSPEYGFRDLAIGPNPARGEISVRFHLAARAQVTLRVYDIAGRERRRAWDGSLAPGACRLAWDGRDEAGRRLPPGIYLLRLEFAPGEPDCGAAGPPRSLARKILLMP